LQFGARFSGAVSPRRRLHGGIFVFRFCVV
jgi:hypothetical protein